MTDERVDEGAGEGQAVRVVGTPTDATIENNIIVGTAPGIDLPIIGPYEIVIEGNVIVPVVPR